MFKLLLTAVLVGVLCSIAHGDTIELTNGGKLHGKIVKEDEKEVTIQLPNKGTITVKRKKIKSIEKNEIEGPKIPPPSESPLAPVNPPRPKELEEKEPEKGKPGPAAPARKEKEEELDPELKKRIDEFVAQLGHRKPSWRANARAQLMGIGKPAVPVLIRAVESGGSSWQRWGAALVLGDLRADSATEALLRQLRDPDRHVRNRSVEALRKITNQNFRYDPFASHERREVAARDWEEWWEKEKQRLKEEEEKRAQKEAEELKAKEEAKKAEGEKKEEAPPDE